MPFLIIGFILIVAIFVYSNYCKQQLKVKIEQKKDFVTSFSPNARIIVNNGNYLFFMDDSKQVFGVDDSGTTYSYLGLKSIVVHRDAIHLSHKDATYKGLQIGKSAFPDDTSVALDSFSISAIENAMFPILHKNLNESLTNLGISSTHEYVNRGVIWGCDVNTKMFYTTHVCIRAYAFSKLLKVTMEDVSDNSNWKCNYIITVTIKNDDGYDDDEIVIYIDDPKTLNNLLVMFKGIKDRQNRYETMNSHSHFDEMDGHEFEHFCATLLRKNGFENVSVTSGSGDQGVDIIAYKDDIKYGIQCKCYHSDIGNKAVQEVYAGKAYYNCHIGIVLTNRDFTRSAIELARNNGVILWNRTKLLQMIENCEDII